MELCLCVKLCKFSINNTVTEIVSVKKHVCYDPKVALLVMQYMCCETIMFILLPRPSTKVC